MIIPQTVPYGLYLLFIIGVHMLFKLSTAMVFVFNAYPLGLTPDGSLCLSMVLYDPHTETYVNDNATICLTRDVNIQILSSLFSLMHAVQPHLHYCHDCCFPSHVHAL